MRLINASLLKSPVNWITVVLMLFIAGIAVHLILKHYTEE